MKLNFGKYKNKSIEEIPVSYLLWVEDNAESLKITDIKSQVKAVKNHLNKLKEPLEMRIGKNKGEYINQLDRDYLKWCLENCKKYLYKREIDIIKKTLKV